jgi:hypothetical protein
MKKNFEKKKKIETLRILKISDIVYKIIYKNQHSSFKKKNVIKICSGKISEIDHEKEKMKITWIDGNGVSNPNGYFNFTEIMLDKKGIVVIV